MAAKLITIQVWECTCTRCGKTFRSKDEQLPEACGKCKSVYWNVEPGAVPRGRPKKNRG